ncbi:sigma-54-dependent transcriptional regulator [Agarilytica rhodophyticola]|uniref:sigma-54-dependent transcriptional regulator n=1 Tax=Agarilytica rhodophyticola TaxID=1737490 RepID=UPI000B346396|nr:sigma-54 dependent transcriptional regulator [Agarilytica rhodophyticola]
MTTRALIIDDEPDIRELLSITLNRMDISTEVAANVSQAKKLLESKTFNLCLTDMRLPDGSGLEIVQHVQKNIPELPIAVITAHGNMDTAVQAMKSGAFDFVNKPIDVNALRHLVNTAITSNQLTDSEQYDDQIIGDSPSIQALKVSIRKLARSQAPIYISGESGSGKELVARSIHNQGPRAKKPFVPVNCGAIPKELMESEFFGHKKGSFTGATQDKLGLFQAAEGGTLFLDEVADLPLDMQVKLLRAIQEKAIRPVGAHGEIITDVRILCATHKNLQRLVEADEFRQDLFYRLNVIQLNVPSLRDRGEDIPALAQYFLQRIDGGNSQPQTTLSKGALAELMRYSFPGNIRELENILERAYTLCDNSTIEVGDLLLSASQKISQKDNQPLNYYNNCLKYPSIDEYLAEVEKEILSDALEHVRWNKTLAAKKLGISFRSFRYRLSKLGLADDTDTE